MSRLSDAALEVQRDLIGGTCFNPGVLAIQTGGSPAVKTTNALNYSVGGLMKTKTALASQSVAPTHNALGQAGGAYVQPIGTSVYYVVALNAAGAVAVVQGSYAGQKTVQDPTLGLGVNSNLGTSFSADGSIPDIPDGYTAIGAFKVVTTSATFTPGTTALDAAGITVTFADLAMVPGGMPF